MIDYPGQELDRVEVPAVPDDIKYLGASLDTVAHWLKKIYDAQRRQESPNPTLINLNPDRIVTTSVRYRLTHLIVSGAAGDRMRLRFGSAGEYDWINVGGDPVAVPLPLVIDVGVNISVLNVTNPAAVLWTVYAVAYVEIEDGN